MTTPQLDRLRKHAHDTWDHAITTLCLMDETADDEWVANAREIVKRSWQLYSDLVISEGADS